MIDDFKVSSDRKGRFYYRESEPSKRYRSVTTVLHWGLPKGKKSDAAAVGSIAHYQILRNYTDEFIEVPTDKPYWMESSEVNKKLEDCIRMWQMLELDDVVEEWLAVEKAVWFEGIIDNVNVMYAGRIDAIARFTDGRIRLVDIKTGDSYDDYPLQMAGYLQAIEYSLNLHIDECYICYLDIGSNWVKEAGKSFPRNPHNLPRIVVYHRAELEEYIRLFNEKLLNVAKECE
jgi:hypothetical protein